MRYAIVLTILITAIVLYIFFGDRGFFKYRELVSIRKEYEKRLADLEAEIERMEHELSLAKRNNEFLENIIRRELGLQKKDEDMYIILDDNNSK